MNFDERRYRKISCILLSSPLLPLKYVAVLPPYPSNQALLQYIVHQFFSLNFGRILFGYKVVISPMAFM